MPMMDYTENKWRTDEEDPCVIRAITGFGTRIDPRIGIMGSVQLAREVVQTHNARLESR